jgi:hypothetical protein
MLGQAEAWSNLTYAEGGLEISNRHVGHIMGHIDPRSTRARPANRGAMIGQILSEFCPRQNMAKGLKKQS